MKQKFNYMKQIFFFLALIMTISASAQWSKYPHRTSIDSTTKWASVGGTQKAGRDSLIDLQDASDFIEYKLPQYDYLLKAGLTFNDTLYFTSLKRVYVVDTLTVGKTIKIKSTGKISGAEELMIVVGHGAVLNFGSCLKESTSGTFDSTTHRVNKIKFTYDGVRTWYNVNQ